MPVEDKNLPYPSGNLSSNGDKLFLPLLTSFFIHVEVNFGQSDKRYL